MKRAAHTSKPSLTKRVAYTAAAVCVVVVAFALVWFTLAPVHERLAPRDPNAALGQLSNKSPEDIQAELNRIVDEGMFNISIAPVVYFADATSEGDIRIENVPNNPYDMQVRITLADTGEEVFTTGIIEPNHHVQTARLSTPLAPGTYPASAVFTALDRQTGDEVGQASANITLVIEG